MDASEEMVSTSSRAGWPAASSARTHRRDAARHPGGGLVVHHRDRLDGATTVLGEPRLDPCRVGAGAPVAFQDLDVETKSSRHRRPQRREVPCLAHQHRVAGRERVHERRLPGAGTRRREDQHVAAGAEDLAQAREHPLARAARTPARGGRWSGAGWRGRILSGTLVGPGIWRKWRPAGVVMNQVLPRVEARRAPLLRAVYAGGGEWSCSVVAAGPMVS